MILKKTYRNVIIVILLACISCKTNNKKEDREVLLSYYHAHFDVFSAKMNQWDLLQKLFVLVDSIEKDQQVKVDTKELDSLANTIIQTRANNKKIKDSWMPLKQDEAIDYLGKANAIHAALDSFYVRDLTAVSEVIRSNASDKKELLRELLTPPLRKIRTAFTEWDKASEAMSVKYHVSYPEIKIEQWNLNKTIGWQ